MIKQIFFIFYFFSAIVFADTQNSTANLTKSEIEQFQSELKRFSSNVSVAVDVTNGISYVRMNEGQDAGIVFAINSSKGNNIGKLNHNSNLPDIKYYGLEINKDNQLVVIERNNHSIQRTVYNPTEFDGEVFFGEPVDIKVQTLYESGVKSAATSSKNDSDLNSDNGSSIKVSAYSGSAAGFTAGLLSGLGFAFRHYFNSGNGYHVGGAFWGNSDSYNFNVSSEYLHMLSFSDNTRFYALGGASVFYSANQEQIYDPAPVPVDPTTPPKDTSTTASVKTKKVTDSSYNAGLGLGIEWVPSGWQNKSISFIMELHFVFSWKESTDVRLKYSGVSLIPSASIMYYLR